VFEKWRFVLADKNQWPRATKETSVSSRPDIRVELRKDVVPSQVQKLTRKFQMSELHQRKKGFKTTHIQTGLLE
jgi:DNA-binding transcriptional regulator YdaS (Cro superfamily)